MEESKDLVKADYGEDPEYTDFICKQHEKVCIVIVLVQLCHSHTIYLVAKGSDPLAGLPFPING